MIPCFRVKRHIDAVLAGIGPEVADIVLVDDHCPEGTGDHVSQTCRDPRVRVMRLPENRGVGGATLAGYAAALEAGADILIKIDGDGQMDPRLIPTLVNHLHARGAD